MVKRMRRQGTRGYLRGRLQRVGGIVNTVRRVESRVSQLERTKEEAKHLILSDSGVPGSSQFLNGIAGFGLRSDNPILRLLNPLERGLTVQQRVGDHAVWTKIRLRLAVQFGASVVSDTWIRWMLIQEYRPEGSPLTVAGVNQVMFGPTGNPAHLNTLPNLNNRSQSVRWKILKKGTLWMRGANEQTVELRNIEIDWYGKGIDTDYARGNSGAVNDIDKNAIYLYMFTNNSVVTNGVGVWGEGHLFYHG